jgi:disulfide bond formation protein DsbB
MVMVFHLSGGGRADQFHRIGRSSEAARVIPLSLVLPSFLVALFTLIGSLWLSVGMSLKACPLCFYQRTFVMGIVAVLGVGLLAGSRFRIVLNVLALPMAVAAFGVAFFHEYLELTRKLECPRGVFGIGSAPQQSIVALTLLLAAIVVGITRARHAGESQAAVSAASVIVGGLLAIGSVVSAPPMPAAPTKPYETALDICRPPFRSP